MRNIWMLVAANLRKSKSQTISLLVFVLIAAIFLNIGLVIYSGIGKFFEERAEQLHTAHLSLLYSQTGSMDKGLQFMEGYPGVAETEILNAVGGMGDYFINDTKSACFLFFFRADENQKMDPPSLVGESLPLTGDAIYIPYFMMLGGGLKTGDDFKLNLSGTELNFTVAGGTEEIMLGAQTNAIHRFYVSDETYYELQRKFPDNNCAMLSARMKNSEDTVFLQADYNREVPLDGLIFTLTYGDAKTTRTYVPITAAMLVTAFAIILLIVSLVVIRFRITNSIEESMTNIGTLKAVGYRNTQIVLSIVFQFGFIALAGGLSGVALSQAMIPAIVKILEPLLALVWVPGFNITAAFVSLMLVLLTVLLISYISARKINKLHPLIALRGGITTHSFKKNAIPLDRSRGSLHLLLAVKQLLWDKKQAFIMGVIIAAVTLASVVGLALHYSMNVNQDSFARAFLGEMFEANFMLRNSDGGDAFKERLLERPEVRKAFGYEFTTIKIQVDGTSITPAIVEDCSLLEGNMLIDGRYPKHRNEIALGTSIARITGKSVGDKVTVGSGETEKEYFVAGIIQYMNNNGFNGIITGDALREIQPDFKFAGYNVYLNGEIDVKAFIEAVERSEGDIFESVINMQETFNSMLGSMGGIFATVAAGIVVVTIFVVVLTLYMVIKTIIIRRKRELGIQKALGYTTFQLMNQIALNLTPVILFSVVIGAVLGYFGFSPLVAALMASTGIVRADLPVPIDWVVITCIALILLAYAVSILIAWRIRKISAYALVSE